MSVRKACVLADQLPHGAQTWRSVGGDTAWTNDEHLLAHVVDVLNEANWQRQGDSNASRPEPLMRPSDAAKANQASDRMLDRAQRFRERTKKVEVPDAT